MLNDARAMLSNASRSRLFPYVVAIAAVVIVVLVGWTAAQPFLNPGDAVVIEVVPIAEPDLVRVQVEGAVRLPGVYDLPVGATVQDATELAGGLTADGQLDAADATRELSNGELVVIASRTQAADAVFNPININTATTGELEALPGIGPVIAERIIAYRETNGGFQSVDQLDAVSGISPRMIDELREMIVVEPS